MSDLCPSTDQTLIMPIKHFCAGSIFKQRGETVLRVKSIFFNKTSFIERGENDSQTAVKLTVSSAEVGLSDIVLLRMIVAMTWSSFS